MTSVISVRPTSKTIYQVICQIKKSIKIWLTELRCSPQLYPWQRNFPMSQDSSRNTSDDLSFTLRNVPICTDWCSEFYE